KSDRGDILLEPAESTPGRCHSIHGQAPFGEQFDPNKHEAVRQVPSSDVPPGSVAEVFRSGFFLHERVLRAAQVAVAMAPPQSTPQVGDDEVESPPIDPELPSPDGGNSAIASEDVDRSVDSAPASEDVYRSAKERGYSY
ncbi:unnamed protein product, partial [Polarella glacialis]